MVKFKTGSEKPDSAGQQNDQTSQPAVQPAGNMDGARTEVFTPPSDNRSPSRGGGDQQDSTRKDSGTPLFDAAYGQVPQRPTTESKNVADTPVANTDGRVTSVPTGGANLSDGGNRVNSANNDRTGSLQIPQDSQIRTSLPDPGRATENAGTGGAMQEALKQSVIPNADNGYQPTVQDTRTVAGVDRAGTGINKTEQRVVEPTTDTGQRTVQPETQSRRQPTATDAATGTRSPDSGTAGGPRSNADAADTSARTQQVPSKPDHELNRTFDQPWTDQQAKNRDQTPIAPGDRTVRPDTASGDQQSTQQKNSPAGMGRTEPQDKIATAGQPLSRADAAPTIARGPDGQALPNSVRDGQSPLIPLGVRNTPGSEEAGGRSASGGKGAPSSPSDRSPDKLTPGSGSGLNAPGDKGGVGGGGSGGSNLTGRSVEGGGGSDLASRLGGGTGRGFPGAPGSGSDAIPGRNPSVEAGSGGLTFTGGEKGGGTGGGSHQPPFRPDVTPTTGRVGEGGLAPRGTGDSLIPFIFGVKNVLGADAGGRQPGGKGAGSVKDGAPERPNSGSGGLSPGRGDRSGAGSGNAGGSDLAGRVRPGTGGEKVATAGQSDSTITGKPRTTDTGATVAGADGGLRATSGGTNIGIGIGRPTDSSTPGAGDKRDGTLAGRGIVTGDRSGTTLPGDRGATGGSSIAAAGIPARGGEVGAARVDGKGGSGAADSGRLPDAGRIVSGADRSQPSGIQPGRQIDQPGPQAARSGDVAARPGDAASRTVDAAGKPVDVGVRPGQPVVKPGDTAPRAVDVAGKGADMGARAGGITGRAAEISGRKVEEAPGKQGEVTRKPEDVVRKTVDVSRTSPEISIKSVESFNKSSEPTAKRSGTGSLFVDLGDRTTRLQVQQLVTDFQARKQLDGRALGLDDKGVAKVSELLQKLSPAQLKRLEAFLAQGPESPMVQRFARFDGPMLTRLRNVLEEGRMGSLSGPEQLQRSAAARLADFLSANKAMSGKEAQPGAVSIASLNEMRAMLRELNREYGLEPGKGALTLRDLVAPALAGRESREGQDALHLKAQAGEEKVLRANVDTLRKDGALAVLRRVLGQIKSGDPSMRAVAGKILTEPQFEEDASVQIADPDSPVAGATRARMIEKVLGKRVQEYVTDGSESVSGRQEELETTLPEDADAGTSGAAQNRRQRYKVRQNDTLESIASNMLGDSRLNGLIYEINKDAIPVRQVGDKALLDLTSGPVIWLPSTSEIDEYRRRPLVFGRIFEYVQTRIYATPQEELRAILGDNWDGLASVDSQPEQGEQPEPASVIEFEVPREFSVADALHSEYLTDSLAVKQAITGDWARPIAVEPAEESALSAEEARSSIMSFQPGASGGAVTGAFPEADAVRQSSNVEIPIESISAPAEMKIIESHEPIVQLSHCVRLVQTVCRPAEDSGYYSRLEVLSGDNWHPVVSYEVRTENSLRHEYSLDGQRKTIRIDLPPECVRELAQNDVARNWQRYCEGYLAGLSTSWIE